MDLNFYNNQQSRISPFNSFANGNQQYTIPNYYIVYQTQYIPNTHITDVYDLKTNSQISQQLQGKIHCSSIQSNDSLNNQYISQPHQEPSQIEQKFQTASEESDQSNNLQEISLQKDQTNYQNLLQEAHNNNSKYQNQLPFHISKNNIYQNQEKSLASNKYGDQSKIINQSEQFYNSDNTLQNQIQDRQLISQQGTEQQIKQNNLQNNEKEQKNNNNKQQSKSCQQSFYQKITSNKNNNQKMEIEDEINLIPQSTQNKQYEFSNCFSLNIFPYKSAKNNLQLKQYSNILNKECNNKYYSQNIIQISQSHSKECKYKLIQEENQNQTSIQKDNQFVQQSKNLSYSQLSTEVKINSESKIDQEKASNSLNQSKFLDSVQYKNQEIQLKNNNVQECSLYQNQKQKIINKNQIKKEKILKKLINGENVKEVCIIKKYQTEDALDIIKNSIFNRKKEIIFQHKYSSQFKLKFSDIKNNEIIFASIKESRRNNRHQNKLNSVLNPINSVIQQIESTPKQDSQNDDKDQSMSSNSSEKNYDGYSKIDQSNINKKEKVKSRFHNLKKLFMYKLVATFNISNMIEIGVPEFLRDILLKLIVRFKISAKKSEEFNRKTEFFSQAHYNALFLYLNEQTICQLAKNKFEIDLEQIAQQLQKSQVSNIQEQQLTHDDKSYKSTDSQHIKQEDDYEEKIQYINILKRYCYQIVKSSNTFGVSNNESQQIDNINDIQNQEVKVFNEQENMRMAYTYRALQGIQTLSKGIFIKKF